MSISLARPLLCVSLILSVSTFASEKDGSQLTQRWDKIENKLAASAPQPSVNRLSGSAWHQTCHYQGLQTAAQRGPGWLAGWLVRCLARAAQDCGVSLVCKIICGP